VIAVSRIGEFPSGRDQIQDADQGTKPVLTARDLFDVAAKLVFVAAERAGLAPP